MARRRLAQTERGWVKVDSATLEVQPGVFGGGDVTGLGSLDEATIGAIGYPVSSITNVPSRIS